MSGYSYRVAPEMVACIGEGRAPTERELRRVADRVSAEIQGTALAFPWGGATDDTSRDLTSLAIARVALSGAAL